MPDTFDKEIIKTFGLRGSPVYEREQKTTDLEALRERIEQTAQPFCTCGAPITTTPDVYRCCSCEAICCQRCHIELSRRNFCPTCAQHRFDLDKPTFLSLLFIHHDLMPPDVLVDITTQAGEVIEIEIDETADALFLNEYLTDDGSLSPPGREALHVGNRLYGDDGDVRSVIEQIQLKKVVEGP